MLDLSQIPLNDLIVAIQYQVNRHLSEYKNVVKVLAESFPDKAHVSKVVSEFNEKIDWLTDIRDNLESSIGEADPKFIEEFKKRHTLLTAAFKEKDYVTPAKPFKKSKPSGTGKRKGPNKPCRHCKVNIRPENHEDHERGCRRNPANKEKKDKKPERKPRKTDPTKPCRHCKEPIRAQNHKRHENACPENPEVKKRIETEAKVKPVMDSRIKAAKKKKKKVMTKPSGSPSPHLPSQDSAFDKKHKAGVKKSAVKNARYLCDSCGHVDIIEYHNEDTIECPKCGVPKFKVIARFNDKGERIEDLQIEEQANVLEEK